MPLGVNAYSTTANQQLMRSVKQAFRLRSDFFSSLLKAQAGQTFGVSTKEWVCRAAATAIEAPLPGIHLRRLF